MTSAFVLIITALLSYLFGSLNFALMISRLMIGDDIRDHGSGNAGTTNVLRNYGKRFAALTFIGDVAKAVVAILIVVAIMKHYPFFLLSNDIPEELSMLYVKSYSGFFCMLGHMFPLFFHFKGGKGVAVAAGMVVMIDYRIAFILLAIFILTVVISKYVSLASVIISVIYPILLFVFFQNQFAFLVGLIFTMTILISHRTNIKNLIKNILVIIN